MENRSYTFFRFCLLCVGIAVLAVSLIAANRSLTGGVDRAITRTLYFGRPVLPDHVFYEVFMASDRVQYLAAPQNQKVLLAIKYAERRYQTGQLLLFEGQNELALTTFSKSQKYLFLAAELLAEHKEELPQETRELVLASLEHSTYRLQLLIEEHPELGTGELSSLLEQTIPVIKKLRE